MLHLLVEYGNMLLKLFSGGLDVLNCVKNCGNRTGHVRSLVLHLIKSGQRTILRPVMVVSIHAFVAAVYRGLTELARFVFISKFYHLMVFN